MELGRHEEAFSEKAQGPDHPDAILMLNNVGVLYHRSLGRHAEAESVLGRVRAIREAALRPGHPDVALTTMHLADVYADWGRHAEAESLYLRALAIWENALGEFGPDHPDVAEALSGLAKMYHGDRRYAEAEPLFKRALAIREKVLGPDHPLTQAAREALNALERDRKPML